MKTIFSARVERCAIGLGLVLLSGCASYQSKPLPSGADLVRSSALLVPTKGFALPGLKPHAFPTNGLDETAVMTLAVVGNPDLKAARLQAQVADAQLLEAGLLPDPKVSGGLSQSYLHTGYSIGLSEDIQALITRGAAKAAAKAHQQQVNLDILWQELQVAEKARELFIQSRADEQSLQLLRPARDWLGNLYREQQAALKRNDISATDAALGLKALTDTENSLRKLEVDANQVQHALNQLLGLEPEVQLALLGRNEERSISEVELRKAMTAVPHHRADLLALQAGYESQEQHFRQAILAQFPSMSVGVEQARSAEEGIHTIGFTVNVRLPIFNRNRGQIAIEKATRQVLYQTYQARLDQAESEAHQVWAATQIMATQLREIEARLPALEESVNAAERSFQRDNLDAAAYSSLRLNLQTEESSAIRLRAELEKARGALHLVLGLPLDSQ